MGHGHVARTLNARTPTNSTSVYYLCHSNDSWYYFWRRQKVCQRGYETSLTMFLSSLDMFTMYNLLMLYLNAESDSVSRGSKCHIFTCPFVYSSIMRQSAAC